MLKGWARFMYEDKGTLVKAGDCVHQRPGIVHYLFGYSADMEYLEVVGPADFTSIEAPGPCPGPSPTPWVAGAISPQYPSSGNRSSGRKALWTLGGTTGAAACR